MKPRPLAFPFPNDIPTCLRNPRNSDANFGNLINLLEWQMKRMDGMDTQSLLFPRTYVISAILHVFQEESVKGSWDELNRW